MEYPTASELNDLLKYQDVILIAIEDRKRITKDMLQKLPPWRARLLAHVAEIANANMEVTHEEVRAEARRVTGTGTLWANKETNNG